MALVTKNRPRTEIKWRRTIQDDIGRKKLGAEQLESVIGQLKMVSAELRWRRMNSKWRRQSRVGVGTPDMVSDGLKVHKAPRQRRMTSKT
jgi:hypothetical protein